MPEKVYYMPLVEPHGPVHFLAQYADGFYSGLVGNDRWNHMRVHNGKAAVGIKFRGQGLQDVGDDDYLYIVAHGSRTDFTIKGPKGGDAPAATMVMDYLAYILDQEEHLPRTHRIFKLFSCFSGVYPGGQADTLPPAAKLARALRGQGYAAPTVFGYVGMVRFNDGLHKQVVKKTNTETGVQTHIKTAKNRRAEYNLEGVLQSGHVGESTRNGSWLRVRNV